MTATETSPSLVTGSQATHPSLPERLRDPDDRDSWAFFYTRYHGLLTAFAKAKGLKAEEAEEIAQDTMIGVVKSIDGYQHDPSRCSFRTWLRAIAHHKIVDLHRRRQRRHCETTLDKETTEHEPLAERIRDLQMLPPDEAWDARWAAEMQTAAIENVRRQAPPEAFRLWHECVMLGKKPSAVAKAYDLSRPRVYLAVHRIKAAVKKEIQSLETRSEQAVLAAQAAAEQETGSPGRSVHSQPTPRLP
jgi:RNA polymerase sigma factor (sigma-70 family)